MSETTYLDHSFVFDEGETGPERDMGSLLAKRPRLLSHLGPAKPPVIKKKLTDLHLFAKKPVFKYLQRVSPPQAPIKDEDHPMAWPRKWFEAQSNQETQAYPYLHPSDSRGRQSLYTMDSVSKMEEASSLSLFKLKPCLKKPRYSVHALHDNTHGNTAAKLPDHQKRRISLRKLLPPECTQEKVDMNLKNPHFFIAKHKRANSTLFIYPAIQMVEGLPSR